MSEFICFLVTFAQIVPYDSETGQASELIKVAIKVLRDDLPSSDVAEYPREYEANLRLLLPPHCQNLGPIVDIEVIFEVEARESITYLAVDDGVKATTEGKETRKEENI